MIAALTAIGSLGVNLQRAVEEQAKSLLGADLRWGRATHFTPEAEKLISGTGRGAITGDGVLDDDLFSEAAKGTRLVQLRALGGGFPFAGKLGDRTRRMRRRLFRHGGARCSEESLLRQFDAKVWAINIKLGDLGDADCG